MADPPNNEVLCNLAWLTRLDVLDHLPLPVLEQITTSVPVPSSSSSTLDGLLGRPGVLQEVQLALQSTSMSHIMPRIHQAVQQQPRADHIIAALTQQEPDLFTYSRPQAGTAAQTPAGAGTSQFGLDTHLATYTHPVHGAHHANGAGAELPEGHAQAAEGAVPERKRRRTKAAQEAEYEAPAEGLDVAHAAGKLTTLLQSMLQPGQGGGSEEQEAGAEGMELEDDEEQAEEGGRSHRKRHRQSGHVHPASGYHPSHAHHTAAGHVASLSPAAVQQLYRELLTARSKGCLTAVPAELLQAMLRAVLRPISKGRGVVLQEDMGSQDPHVASVNAALDAAVAALVVLSAQGLPPEVYLEEVLEGVVELAKYHLQANVLACMDGRWRQKWRPNSEDPGLVAPSTGKKGGRQPKASKKAAHLAGPWFVGPTLQRLEHVVTLLSDVLGAVKVSSSLLLPLVRLMLSCLTVDQLPAVFQVKAASMVASIFRAAPEHRGAVLQELLAPGGLLGHVGGAGTAASSKGPPREFLAQDDPPVHIQVSSALVLQMVQAAAELPPADADQESVMEQLKAPIAWCDRFWIILMDKLPTAKAAKTEGSADIKAFIENLLQDLLAVQHSPEWPAAMLLLRRLVMTLHTSRGLNHPDGAVRLLCIELLGPVVTQIIADCKQAETDQELIHELLAAGGGAMTVKQEDPYLGDEERERVESLQRMLLAHLAAQPPNSLRASARVLLAGQMLHQRLQFEQTQQVPFGSSQPQELAPAPSTGRKGRKKEEKVERHQPEVPMGFTSTQDIVVQYRALHDAPPPLATITGAAAAAAGVGQAHFTATSTERGKGGPAGAGAGGGFAAGRSGGLSSAQCAAISRSLLLMSPLGKGRGAFLVWLVEAGSRTKQDSAAGLRSRAVRALGAAVEADPRVLGMVEVQGAVRSALEDEAVSVREAAVDLLGRHISNSAEYATAYLEVIGRATEDLGVSVRKRAIKVLWDCCVHCPGFQHTPEAIALILRRAGDSEESVKRLATSLCAGLWFSSEADGLDLAEPVEASSFGGPAAPAATKRGPAARAADMAEVFYMVYASESAAIHLPLLSDHQLVVVLKAILVQGAGIPGRGAAAAGAAAATGGGAGAGAGGAAAAGGGAAAAKLAVTRAGASEVAGALLARILELQDAIAAATAAAAAAAEAEAEEGGPCGSTAVGGGAQGGESGVAAGGGAARNGVPAGGSTDAMTADDAQSGGAALKRQHRGSTAGGAGGGASAAAATPFGGPGYQQQGGHNNSSWSGGAGGEATGGGQGTGGAGGGAGATRRSAEAAIEVAEGEQLKCLLVLHALCQADPQVVLAAAPSDPAHFVRGLAPHLKAVQPGPGAPELKRKQAAEQLLAVLHIVEALARGAPHLEERVVREMVKDLTQIINRNNYVTVVAAAVQCMCSLAMLRAALVGPEVTRLALRCHKILENDIQSGNTANSPYTRFYTKFLFTLGTLCRYGAPILDAAAGSQVEVPSSSTTSGLHGAMAVSTQACLNTFLAYINHCGPDGKHSMPLKVRESALQAMSMLFTARPELIMQVPEVLPILESALAPGAPQAFKVRVLGGLIDLLRAEEEGLMARQQQAEAEAATGVDAGAATPSTASKRQAQQQQQQHKSALQRRNGEGDASSTCDAVMRRVWPTVLRLATDVGLEGAHKPKAGAAGGAGAAAAVLALPEPIPMEAVASAAAVRRRVLDLIEAMLRGGLAVPWQGVPPLMALATDPAPDTAAKALAVLKSLCEKETHVDFVCGELPKGLMLAHAFQAQLAVALGEPGAADPKLLLTEQLMGQIVALWNITIAPSAKLKARFLQEVLKPFEKASCLGSGGGAPHADLGLLAFLAGCAASVPLRRADEPLGLLAAINSIVSRRGHSALAALEESVKGPAAGVAAAGAPEAAVPATPHGAMQGLEGPGAAEATPSASDRKAPGELGGAAGAEAGAGAGAGPSEGNPQEASTSKAGAARGPGGPPPCAISTPMLPPTARKAGGLVPGTARKAQHAQVPAHVAAAKAASAVCMLLLLKKYLREAYHLADERIAAFLPSNTAARKAEEKALVTRDPTIRLMIDVLDLVGPVRASDPAGSEPQRSLLKAIKFLLKEDAANYRMAHGEGEGGAGGLGSPGAPASGPNTGDEDGGAMAAAFRQAAAPSTRGAKSTGRGRGRGRGTAAKAAATGGKRKRKARGGSSEEEDTSEEEYGGGSDDEEEGGRSRAGKGGARGRGGRAGGARTKRRLVADLEEDDGDE